MTEAEEAQLADAAAAEALRARLENADAELTAMTLSLEEQRRKAEETLTFLAAAEAVSEDLSLRLAAALSERDEVAADLEALRATLNAMEDQGQTAEELQTQLAAALAARLAAEQETTRALSRAEERAALLAQANDALGTQEAKSAEDQRRLALLNEQVAALRAQLGSLQGLLDAAEERAEASDVELTGLGTRLNTALAELAQEERRRRQEEERRRVLEEAERVRLEEEAIA